MKAQDPNEIFDIVDADDRVVGQATRAEVHARKLFHRAVHILIFTPGGTLILQRRSLAKDTCPGLLSSSCAGHVDAGESYGFAALRELEEELGISVQAEKHLEFVGMQKPSAENGFEFVRIYALRHGSLPISRSIRAIRRSALNSIRVTDCLPILTELPLLTYLTRIP